MAGESIQPAFRPADGMSSGGRSTSIGRQVTVSPGAIVQHITDADDGMRQAAEKLDLMAGGYI